VNDDVFNVIGDNVVSEWIGFILEHTLHFVLLWLLMYWCIP